MKSAILEPTASPVVLVTAIEDPGNGEQYPGEEEHKQKGGKQGLPGPMLPPMLPPMPLRRHSRRCRRQTPAVAATADGLRGGDDDCGRHDFGAWEGSTHWNDGALRRMLHELFALSALYQKDDFCTFHIVRYQ